MKFNFCVACLATDDLHHHHLVARVNGGSDDETNLITLCYSCHRAIHGMRQKSVNHRELVIKGIDRRRAKGLPVGRQKGAIVKSKLDDHALFIIAELEKGTKKLHILSELHGQGVEVTRMSLYRWIDTRLGGKGINKDFHLSKEISETVNHSHLTKLGLEKAKENGKTLGRPSGSEKTLNQIRKILECKSEGLSQSKTAKKLGVGIATVKRHWNKGNNHIDYTSYIT